MSETMSDLPAEEGQPLDEEQRAVEQLTRALQRLESFQHDPSQQNSELGELAQHLLSIAAEHRRQAGSPPFDWDDDEGA
jgi:hypothetical protein